MTTKAETEADTFRKSLERIAKTLGMEGEIFKHFGYAEIEHVVNLCVCSRDAYLSQLTADPEIVVGSFGADKYGLFHIDGPEDEFPGQRRDITVVELLEHLQAILESTKKE